MTVERTAIDGLLVVRWDTHGDERGFFRQTYQRSELAAALGAAPTFRQGNHSRSGPGVLRGFHAEPWDKLVYVTRGRAFCAIADIRPDSATFGEVATFTLGDAPGERIRLYVSEGLANSFLTLEDTDYLYDVTEDWGPIYDKSDLKGFYLAIGTSGNQFKNAPIAGEIMAEIIEACENGRDQDTDPVPFHLKNIDLTINTGFFSRNREINKDSSFSVLG